MIPLFQRYRPAIGLGVTQIIGYGALYYAYAVLLPLMATDLGLSLSQVFGVLSIGLFVGGFSAPIAGILVDRYGGRWVMTGGALAAGIALVSLSQVYGSRSLLVAILATEFAAMFVLYDVAFATLARLKTDVPTQSSISVVTLFGGVASTIFWPLTLFLSHQIGWQSTWMVLGGIMLLVCVPIHWLCLSGTVRGPSEKVQADVREDWPELPTDQRLRGMVWMVLSFVLSGYVMGALMTLWVTNVESLGHSAAVAAFAGAVIGPAKTLGRALELWFGRNLHPLTTSYVSLALILVGFSALLGFGTTLTGLLFFAFFFGMGDGIKTITRGTLPLALFGAKGYGARLGWISFVRMGVNASAPFVFAYLSQVYGGWVSFAAMAACVVAALVTLVFIPDPRKITRLLGRS
ncbi:putative MFS family arabinose efflux permease [Sulfitobacter undariae]|uniref:Putative MFS family arabinose efflux permease n=1 Tax=Sulfitobacter undariae TaxID=1563671 RepID=A0A7W6GYQ2_9RHOB|nr:MFS transporter [Sulfitobacter undariae]MBB3993076.1 putative MFS family arabinose efflux permease [Sulfitobacter undariae]